MFTIHDDQRTASNGRSLVAQSPCGYLEIHMIKPLLPANWQRLRGGVTSPQA